MSLVKRLAEKREKLNAEAIGNLVPLILEKIEKVVDEDTTSLRIRVRLDFYEGYVKLIVNYKDIENIDTSSLLGTKEEKFEALLESLKHEGFEDHSVYPMPEEINQNHYSIGFDI